MIQKPIKSKQYPLKPGKDIIKRGRLLNLLNKGLAFPITLVSAPAGYGKTTILGEWVNKGDFKFAWLSMDENDNDIKRFWYYFTVSLNSFGFTIDESQIYEPKSTQIIPLDSLLTLVVNKIAQIRNECVIILDDFHTITNKEIHATIKIVLENLLLVQNNNFHIVFSSRSDLGFSIARFRAQGKIFEIRTPDLRFNLQETRELLERNFKYEIPPNAVKNIDQHIEGWVTGIKLMILSMSDEDNIQEFVNFLPERKVFVWDYLIDEVLNKQPVDIQMFLLQTSILDQLSAELCNYVTGRSDSQFILEKLHQDNLFISPLDNERKWFRYQHVFQNLLQERLERQSNEEFSNLHMKAYRWYQENTDLYDAQYFALEHVLRAKEFKKAEELLLEISLEMLSKGDIYRLTNYLNRMPAARMKKSTWLYLYKAWTLLVNGNLDQSEKLLSEIETSIEKENRLPPDEQKKLTGYIAAIRSQIVREKGDFIKSLHLSYQAYNNLIREKSILKPTISMNLGNCYLKVGNLVKAEQFLTESHQLCMEVGYHSVSISSLKRLGDIKYLKGLYLEAENIYKRGMSLGQKWGQANRPLFYTAMIYPRLGLIEYERNNLDNAFDYFEKGKYLGEQSNIPTLMLASYIGEALVHMANDETAPAKAEIDRASELLEFSLDTFDVSLFQKVQLMYYRKINNSLMIQAWINNQKIDLSKMPMPDQELVYISLIRAYIFMEKFENLQAYLGKLSRKARSTNRVFLIVETLILSSIVDFNTGEQAKAMEAFCEAVELAELGGFQRVFLDESGLLAELVKALCAEKPELVQADLIRKILKDTEKKPEATNQFEELSERELEIINLVAAGKTNQEIADLLFITIGTVKWHLMNIYGKLNSTNRVQAINVAKKLNIIQSN